MNEEWNKQDPQAPAEDAALKEDGEFSQGPEEAQAEGVEPEVPQVEEAPLPEEAPQESAGKPDAEPEPPAEKESIPVNGADAATAAPEVPNFVPPYGVPGTVYPSQYPGPQFDPGIQAGQPVSPQFYGVNQPQGYPAYPGYPPQPYPAYPAQPPVQAQGYPQPGVSPYPTAAEPAAQAHPVPQAYPQGGPYPPYPAYYGGQQPEQKKKKSLGFKIFVTLAVLLAVAAIAGSIFYFVIAAGNSPSNDRNPFFGYGEPFDGYNKPFDGEYKDEDPDESPIPSLTPTTSPQPTPDVDVTPNTEGIVIYGKPQGEPLDAEAVYNAVAGSTVSIKAVLDRDGQTGESSGTGIIATSDGYIITNSHVVLNSKSTRVTVTTYDGQEYEAVVVGVDRTTDLAVLKTNDHNFTPAEFGNAAELSVGEWVLAIGNPGGDRFSSSLTRGIVSGLDREVGKYSENGMTYIQTDAAINPGNSGGPLVNMYGQVVGINSSKIVTEGYEGMGFAIPVSKAHPIINELLSGGYIKGRTRLGIMCQEINSSRSAINGIPQGLLIQSFNEDSSFNGTEAQEGDIIIAIEGNTVENLRDVSNLLLSYVPGDRVSVTLYRPGINPLVGGQEIEVTITLLEDTGETQE